MHIENSEFQDRLLQGLTHRMNNILSLFHGYLALLLEGKKLDPDVLDGLARIKEGASAASELMDRTNALARQPSAVWRELKVPDFLHLLKQTCEEYLERGVRLEIQCPETMPCLWADPAKLRAALTEIVRNACQASPDNGTVKILGTTETPIPQDIENAPEPITWISIAVTDQGDGIDGANSEKVFQPFFSTKREQSATGLGLTVALGMVQQLGGVIRMKSRPGKTCFRVLLPSRSAPAPADS